MIQRPHFPRYLDKYKYKYKYKYNNTNTMIQQPHFPRYLDKYSGKYGEAARPRAKTASVLGKLQQNANTLEKQEKLSL